MTKEVCQKIFDAMESAGITTFEILTDGSFIRARNNEFDTVKWDGDETFICIRSEKTPSATSFAGNIRISVIHMDQIEEIRVGGELKQMKDYISALGFSLTEEEEKKIVKIESYNNRTINPLTGDYFDFAYLSEEEYEALTPEEKVEYDKKKAEYEAYKNEHYMGQGGKFVPHVEY